MNTDVDDPIRVRCNPRISNSGATALPNDAGPNQFADLHQNDTASSGAAQVHTSIPVTGSILVPAGTYNVGIVCVALPFGGGNDGTANRFQAAVNVIAVPASS